jgi:RNA polymerase sigma factor (sigma-70 family)
MRCDEAAPAREGKRAERSQSLEGLTARGVSVSAVRRAARNRRLEAAFARLTGERREVILLARKQGLSMKAISDRMGRSSDSVRLHILRALRDLRQHYEELQDRSGVEGCGSRGDWR